MQEIVKRLQGEAIAEESVPGEMVSGPADTTDCLDDGLETVTTSRSQNSARAMFSEQTRLETFVAWPSWARALPADLASHGFYFTEQGDRVRCAFCGLEVEGWTSEMGGDVYLVHWRSARDYCALLRGEDVGNVPRHEADTQVTSPADVQELRRALARSLPATSTRRTIDNRQERSSSQRARAENDVIVDTQPVLVVAAPGRTEDAREAAGGEGREASSSKVWAELVRTAQYPHMASLQARLATFSRWPLLKPGPRELAKAGLFRLTASSTRPSSRGEACTPGSSDSVRCFWCGERLHRWRCTDDAALEHARLSPHCRFARQLLGHTLHDDVISTTSFLSRPDPDLQPSTPPRHIQHQQQQQQQQPTSADDAMNSPAVTAVLQMGFPPELIRSLLEHNSPLLDPHTLCTLALQASQAEGAPQPDPVERRRFGGRGEGQGKNQGQGHDHRKQGSRPPAGQETKNSGEDQRQAVEARLQEMSRKYSSWQASSRFVASPPPEENARSSAADRLKCKVCREEEVSVTLRPCGHLASCSPCSRKLKVCPACQEPIRDKIVTYLS